MVLWQMRKKCILCQYNFSEYGDTNRSSLHLTMFENCTKKPHFFTSRAKRATFPFNKITSKIKNDTFLDTFLPLCKVVFASRGGLSHFASFIRSTKVRLMSLFLHQMAVLFIPPSPQVSQMVFSLGRDERNKESLLKFFSTFSSFQNQIDSGRL